MPLDEFLSGSLRYSTRSGKKFLTMFYILVHENSVGSIATENLLLMSYGLKITVGDVHLLIRFGMGS